MTKMMKREIRFRGKEKAEPHRWMQGFYYEENGSSFIWTQGKSRMWPIEVDESTVGQFIGAKDKNGTPIYEGDIVYWKDSYGHEFTKEVKFEKSHGRFIPIGIYMGYDCTVSGNVYDNPELLEVKKQKPPKNGLLPNEFRIRALYDNGCMSKKGHVYIAEHVKVGRKEYIRVWSESSKLDDECKRRYGTYMNADLSILGDDEVMPIYEIVKEELDDNGDT